MTHHQLHADRLVEYENLTRRNHRVTSNETDEYNCFAWAISEDDTWYSPARGYAWPTGIRRDEADPQSVVEFYSLYGYAVCGDSSLELGFEKIAIYVHPDGYPTHAARQLPTGRWTSKLGGYEDIEHHTPHDVEGVNGPNPYGTVRVVMRRPRAT